MAAPDVVVFDVNETLSDMASMADRFIEIGAPESTAKLWFATVLRDGFALATAGATATFRTIAEGALRDLLAGVELTCDRDPAVERILEGFLHLPAHADVVEGVTALKDQGLRLVTLTNGSTEVADRLLLAAGIRDHFEQLLSVDAAGVWKPAAGAYSYAARSCDTAADRMLLVAVHPWDIDGAARAGLRTAWINRSGATYPGYFTRPDITVAALDQLPQQLSAAR